MAKPLGMILAAGFGSRLLPLTKIRPKPMMELAGIPIIFHLIKIFERAGIKDIFINLHYGAEYIKKTLSLYFNSCNIYFSEEEEILGTAGGVSRVINKFGLVGQKLVVSHGDILCDIDLLPFLALDQYCTLICAKDREINGYVGSVGNDSEGTIAELGRFYKKPAHIVERGFFTGIHILSNYAVKDLAKDQSFGLVSDVYPAWLKEKKKLKALMIDMAYEDLGAPDRIWQANMNILDNIGAFRYLDLVDHNNFISSHDSRILIHKNTLIDKTALIGPKVIIGDGVIVNSGARISNSVVMSQTEIEKLEHLDCAIALGSARVLL